MAEILKAVREVARNDKKLAGVAAVAGVTAGLIGVAGITMRDHRELTHRSLELHPLLHIVLDAEQRSLGIKGPEVWAAVHRIHHNMTDATLKPFLDIHRAIQAADGFGMEVPDTFAHLDPFVSSFSRDEVQVIGAYAEKEVHARLGKTYQRQRYTDREKIQTLLHPTEPQYYYPDYDKHSGEYTQDEKERILLTDPHSPALVRQENGVQGIAKSNIGLYSRAADLFRKNEELRPDDLPVTEKERKSSIPAVVAGFLVPSVAVLLARGQYQPKDVAKAAVVGSAINGLRTGVELIGGNVTNSLGHGGDMADSLGRAALERGYKIKLNPDGTLSTDTRNIGFIGKALSYLTFDEVGGQDVHHKHPEKIAYTMETGMKALKEAPWGSFLEWLAHNEHMPLIKPGEGFRGIRPDLPHEGVVIIQQARAREYATAA